MGDRPTLEELRQREKDRRLSDLDDDIALRWAKDQLLTYAAEHVNQIEATLPEDANKYQRAWVVNLKRAMRDLWDSYQWAPNITSRPYSDYEPPEDFHYGEIMEQMHHEMNEKYGRADHDPYGGDEACPTMGCERGWGHDGDCNPEEETDDG